MKTATIEIDGTDTEIDLEDILTIRTPETERMEVAVHLGYWGAIFGAKLEEEEMSDAAYRQWRAQTTVSLLETDAKAAEWKVKSVVEADEGFMACKRRIAKSKRDVASAKAIFDAFSRKADILARLIAREDTERVRSGDVGRMPESRDPAVAAEKMDKVKAAIEATRAKKDATKK